MQRAIAKVLAFGALAPLVAVLGVAFSVSAQDARTRYPSMGPIERYLIPDRNAEIALARSAAPYAISRDATVLILGSHGYETALKGTNGFVCMVERSWTEAIDFPEVWNSKIRGPVCLNPPAARSLLPIIYKKTAMLLAGYSKAEMAASLRAAFQAKQLPALEPGAMSFMMSKSAYLTDDDHHNVSHVMFFTTIPNGRIWGAGLPGSPIESSSYWFPADENNSLAPGLPPMRVFIVGVKRWSDGTLASVK